MTPIQLVRSLLEAVYDYATTDISLPTEMGTFLLNWNELNIPDDVLFEDEDGGKGREDEPHITVKYGLLTKVVPDELKKIAQTTAPFPITLGKVSLFNNPKFDVVKLDVESPALHELNRRVSDAVPHEDTYPDYKPHATLAYVQKGSCDHLVGENPFKEKDTVNQFMAPGMRFAGAGDSEGDERVVEMLLFSKARNPGEVEESVSRVFDRMHSTRVNTNANFRRNQEIKAWAASMVESWFRQGLTTDQMLRRLSEGQWGNGMKYWASRESFPHSYNHYVEQATEFINQLREAKFAEAAVDVDPFANCGFPVDSDRVRQFLRNNGKRRNERTLL